MMSYLPAAHVFGFICECIPLYRGGRVGYFGGYCILFSVQFHYSSALLISLLKYKTQKSLIEIVI